MICPCHSVPSTGRPLALLPAQPHRPDCCVSTWTGAPLPQDAYSTSTQQCPLSCLSFTTASVLSVKSSFKSLLTEAFYSLRATHRCRTLRIPSWTLSVPSLSLPQILLTLVDSSLFKLLRPPSIGHLPRTFPELQTHILLFLPLTLLRMSSQTCPAWGKTPPHGHQEACTLACGQSC